MDVCTLSFRFRHLEFEPSRSAVAPNPTSFKNGVLGQKDPVSHWMDKIIYEAALTRSNTARKYWSPTKLFVIRKIVWMYLYRNCLQRYTKCVAFLELNGIKKSCPVSVGFLRGIFYYLMGHFPNSREVQNLAGAPQKWGTGASFAVHAMGIQE